jgi:formate hydrogenlyase subunit 3/multisubunit Na+/H+ antiporter MnhD subunit
MAFEGIQFASTLFNLHLITLITGCLAILLLPAKIKPLAAAVSAIIVSVVSCFLAFAAIKSKGIEIILTPGSFIGSVPLRIDGLSAWFILIVSFVTLTGVLYGVGYMKAYSPLSSIASLHWLFFLLFQSSMLLVCMVQNAIAFIVVWEVMSVSSLFLVLFDHTNLRVLKAGINYMVQMHISVVFLTIAFIWVYFKTGTWDFKGIETFFIQFPNIGLFMLFFAGFGLKAGFIGLHTWLPHAHPAAPSHVSGVMSGVIVKMGIYGILRMIIYLKADYLLLGELIIAISLVTGIFGIMNASVHRDFKKMLAYCTIENIGIIGIGIGLGLVGMAKQNNILCFLGFGGALLHVLNHSLFKSLLFFSAGSVYQQTHTRDIEKLGGILRSMPQTGGVFLLGAIAIAGIPPLNGFVSEFLIYSGLLLGIQSPGISQITLMMLALAGLSIIGGISVLTFTKTFSAVFLGSPRKKTEHASNEVSPMMLIPQYMTIALMLAVAFFPMQFLKIPVQILAENFSGSMSLLDTDIIKYSSLLKSISIFSMVFILIVGMVLGLRYLLTRKRMNASEQTWGCAYPAPNTRMQYTGKSFTKSFAKLFGFILIETKEYKELESSDVFPKKRKYSSHYTDIFERNLIQPFSKQLNRFINLFTFIQNGKIQTYVVYGIAFILIVFIGTIFNLWH